MAAATSQPHNIGYIFVKLTETEQKNGGIVARVDHELDLERFRFLTIPHSDSF